MDYTVLTIVGSDVTRADFATYENASEHLKNEVKAIDPNRFSELAEAGDWPDTVIVGSDAFVIIVEQA